MSSAQHRRFVAANPRGAALLAEALFGPDAGGSATLSAPRPRRRAATEAEPPVLALVRPPGWDDADPDLQAAFDALAAAPGDRTLAVAPPACFDEAARLGG